MATLSSIRLKLQNKVFDTLGSTMTVSSISTSTDKWGDSTTLSTVTSTTQCVPFNYINRNKSFQPFGVLSDGEFDVIVPYTTVISVGNYVTYDSNTWDVFRIEKFPYADGNIALLVRLKQQI